MHDWHDTIPIEEAGDVLGSTFVLPTSCRGGSCRQGRSICKTPLACQIHEDAEFGALEGLLSWPSLMSVALVGAIVLLMIML